MSHKLTQAEADVINTFSPGCQVNQPLGQKIKEIEDYAMVIVPLEIAEDAPPQGINFTMPSFNMRIANVVVQCTETKGQAKVKLRRVNADITEDVECALNGKSRRAASVATGHRDIVANEILNVRSAQNARGILYIMGHKL